MIKIIHISDTHLIAPSKKLFGIDGWNRLEKAIASINQHHQDADFLVLTGDITDAGDEQAYRAFIPAMQQLCCPYYLLIGNHDNRETMQNIMPDLQWNPDGFLQYDFH